MEVETRPKVPIQFEKPLKEYKVAYLRYQELRSRPSADVARLDSLWRKNQSRVLQIEDSLIKQYGKQIAEQMLEDVIGWKTLPRV